MQNLFDVLGFPESRDIASCCSQLSEPIGSLEKVDKPLIIVRLVRFDEERMLNALTCQGCLGPTIFLSVLKYTMIKTLVKVLFNRISQIGDIFDK